MKQHLCEAIDEFRMVMKQAVSTPAKCDIFDMSHISPRLTGIDAETFHSVVMKQLDVVK
jgi:hypothetical protein